MISSISSSTLSPSQINSNVDKILKTQYQATPIQSYQVVVSETCSLYVEESGNPNGIPALFIHGGPGMRFLILQIGTQLRC